MFAFSRSSLYDLWRRIVFIDSDNSISEFLYYELILKKTGATELIR